MLNKNPQSSKKPCSPKTQKPLTPKPLSPKHPKPENPEGFLFGFAASVGFKGLRFSEDVGVKGSEIRSFICETPKKQP